MQPPPPPRRRRRSTRAAGPSRPAEVAAADIVPASADDVATEPYRMVDGTVDHGNVDDGDRTSAPVVPPSPPAADGPGRPTRSPGGPGPDPGRFGRWPTGGRRARPAREEMGERSLRALVTSRTTALPPTVAMRAREVEVPTPEDLARAEAELVIVRRNYVPPTALSTGRRSGRPRGERPVEDRARRRSPGNPRPLD